MPGASVPDGPDPPPPALDRSRLAPRAHVQPGGAIRLPRPHLLVLLTLPFLPLACDDGTAPPPTPDRLEVVAGDAQSARVETRLAEALTVRVEAADGRPVPGATVAWRVASGGGSLESEATTTDAGGVATNRWTLGPEVGEQTAVASVAGALATEAVFTATAEPAPLAPDADMELSGTVQAADVRIPEGVTVRVTDDVRIEASGEVEIAGTVQGDCREIRIASRSGLTITGIVRNDCADQDGGQSPGLEVIGQGEVRIEGATLASSGPLVVKNHPTLSAPEAGSMDGSDADGSASSRAAPITTGSQPREDNEVNRCLVVDANLTIDPLQQPPGAPGTRAEDGLDGADVDLLCDGVLFLLGQVRIVSQYGGTGGEGSHSSQDMAVAYGGNGGDGGDVRIGAREIRVEGDVLIESGGGGWAGETTRATAEAGKDGLKAAGAYAEGGWGGSGGNIEILGAATDADEFRSVDVDVSGGRPLRLVPGHGGWGGRAFAGSADGVHATDSRHAQEAGDAVAVSGPGGNGGNVFVFSPDGDLPAGVQVGTAHGGGGRRAWAGAGRGGNGSRTWKDGAAGGRMTASAGDGGDAGKFFPGPGTAGIWTGEGGPGGSARVEGGRGGAGWNGCRDSGVESGGNGGRGGNLDEDEPVLGLLWSTVAGSGGSGYVVGDAGTLVLRRAGNGGPGGDGLSPGDRGPPGRDGSPETRREGGDDSFQPGPDGSPCPLPPTVTIDEPEEGAIIHSGSRTRFRAGIDDPNQATFGDDAVRWTSDREGEIGTGPSVTTDDLSPGPHEIEVAVTDEDGNTATAHARIRVNDRPHVSILSPGQGETFASGSAIPFSGSATDREDGPVSGDAFEWVSSRDGPLGEGASISRSDLSDGEHRISLIATDSDGGTGGAHIRVDVVPPGVNQPPEATILSPEDGFVVTRGDDLTLEGTAEDPEDGPVTSPDRLSWLLEHDDGSSTEISDGSVESRGPGQYAFISVTNTDALPPGPTTVRFFADDGSLTGTDAVEIVVDEPPANEPPTATITSPVPGALTVYEPGEEIAFAGEASDPDGDLSGAGSSIVWESDIDGVLAEGILSFSRNDLSVGLHQLTLTVTDGSGASAVAHSAFSVSPANEVPVITIDDPSPGTVFASDDDVTFRATASDPEDGTLSGGSILWASSQDGSLGTGSTLTTSGLTQGDHTITATAADSDGQTASDQTEIHMNGVPLPLISSPSDGDVYQSGDPIPFSGSATDPEDGTLTGGSLVWTSSLDGEFGTGSSLSVSNLSDGSHQITLTATDSYGQSASTSVGITVVAPSGPKPIFYTQTDASSGVIRSVSPEDPGNTSALAFFSGEISNGMRIAYDPDPFAVVHRQITDVGPPIQYEIQGRVLTMEDDGSNQQEVTTTQAFYRRGSADPSGTRLVFESDLDDPQGDLARSVVNDVFVMNVDGSGLTKVVTEAANPSFTPAGRIVYSTDADADDRWEVRIADADGANPSLLVTDDDTESYGWEEPVVSPDGTKIAVTRIDMDTFQRSIVVGDFDGASVTNLQVVAAPVDAFEPGSLNPTWSPDSQRIAFSSTRSGDQEIWVMNADGSNKVNLSQSPVTADFHPFWEAP